MKIVDDSKKSEGKGEFFGRWIGEVYYFLKFHIYMVMSIVGLSLFIALLVFLAEWLFPDKLHIFNISMSERVFRELVEDNRYHAAINLMEIKVGLIEESDEPYAIRMELADCYIHTGDYPKALEQYRLIRDWFDAKIKQAPPEEASESDLAALRDFVDICLLKEEYRIYLKMGDKGNISKLGSRLKKVHDSTGWRNFSKCLSEEGEKEFKEELGDYNMEEGFRLEIIQSQYFSDSEGAIREMEKYALNVANTRKFNIRYKLRVFNELLRMQIEQGDRLSARYYLDYALRLVDNHEYNTTIYRMLGDLSEHCYALNDRESGLRLLKKYLRHIDDTYDREDIEYAVAHAKEYKYLESDGEWEELNRRVIEGSASLREQITKNFTGITSAQREYFIEQFKPTLTYANSLMERHPSNDLAVACFENNIFLRGLLLRSETTTANTIRSIGDKELSAMYDRYVELSREMVARRYVSGPGNYLKLKEVERELPGLEEEIASRCREFRRENELGDFGIDKLRSGLSEDEVVMEIVEGDTGYFSLLMDRRGRVTYHPLAGKEKMAEVMSTPGLLYVDEATVREIMGDVIEAIRGKRVYLTTSGQFNQVAVGALAIDGKGGVLSDIAEVRLVGSLMDLPALKESEGIALKGSRAMLWGGVDYGDKESGEVTISETRGIMRGDRLGELRFSKSEVDDVAGLLRSAGCRAEVVSGVSATERSFVGRSGKGEYLLHVSTHGFFHDEGAFTNPMQNCGLLFAGSQRYWMKESLAESIDESDGILRADEIAGMDLCGCRLVVLSACQTGLGAYNSEGVYGLQRAFKLAGVESVLMSLWSVDDAVTGELMVEFYREVISGKSLDGSLVSAQRRLRAKGYSPDKWAAFVLLN